MKNHGARTQNEKRVLWFFLCMFLLFPGISRAEIINTFITDIRVTKDARVDITEEITYTFDTEKHGIYRCIPTRHAEPASSILKERYIDIEVKEVSLNGTSVPYTSSTGAELCLKIGDENKTITGEQTYRIRYHVLGVLSYELHGGAELYWNVTGNGWDVPITYAEVRLTTPDSLFIRGRACYRGAEGEPTSCRGISEDNGVITFRDGLLSPHEGVTIAQALDRTVLAYDVRERYRPLLVYGLSILLIVGGALFALYRYKTKFKTETPIIPQYEPYPGVRPMYAGYLFDRRLDPRDITAGIVYLGEQGFLKIRKTEKKVLFLFEVDDYEFTLLRPRSEIGTAFEAELIALIFGTDGGDVGATVALSTLKGNIEVGMRNRDILMTLRKRLKEDLLNHGYIMGFDFFTLFSTPFIVSLIVVAGMIAFVSNTALIVFVVGLIGILFVISEGRRTKKGYEALNHLKGFKDFLRVTEKERYIFHNAPERNAEQFMEYLPYAIAFGVEKEWAKTFEHITIPNPGWYDGGSTHTFNAMSLTQSIGGFSNSLQATSAGGSASSGGGSSGGGSGGGGGGSW